MARIKEIWCMPHSHLDIGYTHPQPMLLELQSDYLQQALELCRQTRDYPEGSRFCWTVEANYILRRWLKTASEADIALLKEMIQRGQICVTALPFHTTPCADANELVHLFSGLDELRQLLNTKINVAINHDVNGQPWTLSQFLLDSGVDFYLTGINIHFGGVPFIRPSAFLWETADGRKLPTFLGEHYSLFSQYLFTEEHSTARMHEGAAAYADWLEKLGYERDFAFLTATNPPLYDNNCPDAQLSDLVRQYNEEGHEFRIRLVTAQDLRSRILAEGQDSLPTHRGDWTDYWNFGAGSTAREGRVSRLGKQDLEKSEVVECFTLQANAHRSQVKKNCYESTLIFEEHTWGASQAITHPDHPETYSQLIHKQKLAYEAADLSGYLLGSSMELLSGNPHQSNSLGGVTVVNTSSFPQTVELKIPNYYLLEVRQLASLRIKECASYLAQQPECTSMGLMNLPPFTRKTVPFTRLEASSPCDALRVGTDFIETPHCIAHFDPATGAIRQLTERSSGRTVLDESRGYGLFQPIRESIDEAKNLPHRKTLFPRDVDLGNHSITQWNHEWKSLRTPAKPLGAPEILRENHSVTLVSRFELPGTSCMEQRITFYSYRPQIRINVRFLKHPVYEPESVYFAVPLKLSEGWKCSYDTAGQFVRLDEEQIGNVCRDWVTVDSCVSVYHGEGCVTLACPDAPLVQVGDFGFGRESRSIARSENPLLLAWALNNYWDTNFCANQSGAMEFTYELTVRDAFHPTQALADGTAARNPCVLGASVSGEAAENTLLNIHGKSVVLNMYPEEDCKAIRLILTNPEDAEDLCLLSLPGKTVVSAQHISPAGDVLSEAAVADNTAHIPVPAKSIRLLRLKIQ